MAGASAAGAIYLNEIHVAVPITRVGSAQKLQADFDYTSWGTFGYKLRSVDRNFQTPTSVVSNQDNRTDNLYLNFTRLSWMPVTMNGTISKLYSPIVAQKMIAACSRRVVT